LIRTRSMLDLKVAIGGCVAGACVAPAPIPKVPTASAVTRKNLIVVAAYLQSQCQMVKLFIMQTLFKWRCPTTSSTLEKLSNYYAIGRSLRNHYTVAIAMPS
jgi:hypothetical protein